MNRIVSTLYLPQYQLDPFHIYTFYQQTFRKCVVCWAIFFFFFKFQNSTFAGFFALWHKVYIMFWARFLSLAQSKLRLCSANNRAGYWSNLPCDWLSTAWAYSEQETENGPRSSLDVRSYLRTGWSDWHGTKGMCVNWCKVWSTSWPWPLTPPMTLTLDFQGQILENCISGIGGLVDMKEMGYESIRCWTHYITLTFDPHPWPRPWIFKVKFWDSCVSGMYGTDSFKFMIIKVINSGVAK